MTEEETQTGQQKPVQPVKQVAAREGENGRLLENTRAP